MKISICDGWEFSRTWSDAFLNGSASGVPVRLPHNIEELPLHYALPEHYEGICGYRRKLSVGEELKDKRLFLRFDGAAHIAKVFCNGKLAGEHRCGYTAFEVEITDLVHAGNNDIAVRLDCTENGEVPPFGFVIDYLTYGGLYREVWLIEREKDYIEDVFAYATSKERLHVDVKCTNAPKEITLKLFSPDGTLAAAASEAKESFDLDVPGARNWSVDDPALYKLHISASFEGANDEYSMNVGIRTAEFNADGFFLNGEKVFLRGLNRHQCYSYIGYAAPEHLQREDARILKEELACTAVRTSHYPQSHHFIDECDRLGLCVFTEIPGWQHIGDEKWKEQACENVREMVKQYRNHPSIVLWGVRINESQDDDEFYKKTNEIAHELDPSRATSGVRYLEKSHLFEDVYAFNDFSHNGPNKGVRPKKKVTTDMNKGFLVSEHNGHMFPTKSFDVWEKRQEHALRHARVQNDAAADGEHAGCFGWCMFDYPTHKDFGSGDRICYHGVLDSFRNPKLAAAVYASQGDKTPVLEIGSSFDIGDYPAGYIGKIYAFTNADELKLYKNDKFVASFKSKDYSGLPHGPILIDDMIGELLHTEEGFSGKKEKLLRECLLAAGKYGMSNMPLSYKLKMAYCMARYKMTFKDGLDLYGKYIGNWGGEATRWRFDAVKNGEVVKSVVKTPGSKLHLEAIPSKTKLVEGDTYDMAALRLRIFDENGNESPYAQLPLSISVSGEIELVGPSVVTAEGGMCGTYIRSCGKAGRGEVTVSASNAGSVTVSFAVKTK